MKNRKRILSLALAAVMVLAFVPTAARAAEYTATKVAVYSDSRAFQESLAAVQDENGKWGFIDTTGKEVIHCHYDYAGDFSESLARVCIDRKWGFIDTTGKEVIPCHYDYAGDFSEGLAAVRIGEKTGCIDTTGKEVIPCKYDIVDYFSEGLARVMDTGKSGKWGLIDVTGKEVVPCKYDDVGEFSGGLAPVKMGDWETYKYGFIDTTGKEIVPCKFVFASSFSEGLAKVGMGDWETYKYGFIDTTGREIVPCKYDYADSFFEGLARMYIDGKWGFIGTTGKEIIPRQYDDVYSFSEGLAAVCVGRKWGFIDATGKEVISCKYDYADYFSEGLARMYIDGKWGFIDATGKEVIPRTQYDGVGYFSGGLALVRMGEGDWETCKYGFIDITGKEVIPCQYSDASVSDGIVLAKDENGKSDIWVLKQVAPAPIMADPTNDALKVDGVSQVPAAYKIGGANYFLLRDVAMLLNGTKGQFSVDYDGVNKAVKLTTGEAYQPLGTELAGAPTESQEAIVGNDAIYINGEKADLAVYKIGGANYFKIRDLGKALGFNVGWTAEKGMFIESDKPYTDAD